MRAASANEVMRISVQVCVSLCVCVCVRDRESEAGDKRDKEKLKGQNGYKIMEEDTDA